MYLYILITFSQLDFLSNSAVEFIYNPIDYAKETHRMFLRLYADSAPKKIVFLGMNPGPFGILLLFIAKHVGIL